MKWKTLKRAMTKNSADVAEATKPRISVDTLDNQQNQIKFKLANFMQKEQEISFVDFQKSINQKLSIMYVYEKQLRKIVNFVKKQQIFRKFNTTVANKNFDPQISDSDKKKRMTHHFPVRKRSNSLESSWSSNSGFFRSITPSHKQNGKDAENSDESFGESSVKSAIQNAYDLGIEAEASINKRIDGEKTYSGQPVDIDLIMHKFKERVRNRKFCLLILDHQELKNMEKENLVMYRVQQYFQQRVNDKLKGTLLRKITLFNIGSNNEKQPKRKLVNQDTLYQEPNWHFDVSNKEVFSSDSSFHQSDTDFDYIYLEGKYVDDQFIPSSKYYLPQEIVSLKEQREKLVQKMLFCDKFNYGQRKQLQSMNKELQKQLLYFINHSLETKEYPKAKLNEISQRFDACNLDKSKIIENYVKENCRRLYNVQDFQQRKAQIAQNQLSKDVQSCILIFKAKLTKMKYTIFLNADFQMLMSKFNFENFKGEIVYSEINKDRWIQQRLLNVKYLSTIRSSYLFERATTLFWHKDQNIVKNFLKTTKTKNFLGSIDLPCDQNLSPQKVDKWQDCIDLSQNGSESSYNSFQTLSDKDFNEVQAMHEKLNPLNIIDKVVIMKNASYEIFQILSQTKQHKVKNKLKIQNEQTELELNFLLNRIKQISICNLVRDNEKCKKQIQNSRLLEELTESSSEFQSQISVKQTAKYFYVEYNELVQDRKKQLRLRDKEKREEKKSSKLTQSIELIGESNFIQPKFRKNKSLDVTTNNLINIEENKNRRQSVSKEQTQSITDPQIILPPKGNPYGEMAKMLDKKKQNNNNNQTNKQGLIRLSNGLHLSLENQPNVDFNFTDFTSQPKSITMKRLKKIQSYYDYVKKQIISSSINDNIIINYRRSYVLDEKTINKDKGRTLKKLNQERLKKYMVIIGPKPAINIDLTKFINKKYVNPFEQNFDSKKQQQQQQKPNDFRCGKKCHDFIFTVKLQSIACNGDVRELNNEIIKQGESLPDINMCPLIYDKEIGYPIYMTFEKIIVQKKIATDFEEEHKILTDRIKQMTKPVNQMKSVYRKSQQFKKDATSLQLINKNSNKMMQMFKLGIGQELLAVAVEQQSSPSQNGGITTGEQITSENIDDCSEEKPMDFTPEPDRKIGMITVSPLTKPVDEDDEQKSFRIIEQVNDNDQNIQQLINKASIETPSKKAIKFNQQEESIKKIQEDDNEDLSSSVDESELNMMQIEEFIQTQEKEGQKLIQQVNDQEKIINAEKYRDMITKKLRTLKLKKNTTMQDLKLINKSMKETGGHPSSCSESEDNNLSCIESIERLSSTSNSQSRQSSNRSYVRIQSLKKKNLKKIVRKISYYEQAKNKLNNFLIKRQKTISLDQFANPIKKKKLNRFKGYGENSSDYISSHQSQVDTLKDYDEVYQAEYEVELEKMDIPSFGSMHDDSSIKSDQSIATNSLEIRWKQQANNRDKNLFWNQQKDQITQGGISKDYNLSPFNQKDQLEIASETKIVRPSKVIKNGQNYELILINADNSQKMKLKKENNRYNLNQDEMRLIREKIEILKMKQTEKLNKQKDKKPFFETVEKQIEVAPEILEKIKQQRASLSNAVTKKKFSS